LLPDLSLAFRDKSFSGGDYLNLSNGGLGSLSLCLSLGGLALGEHGLSLLLGRSFLALYQLLRSDLSLLNALLGHCLQSCQLFA